MLDWGCKQSTFAPSREQLKGMDLEPHTYYKWIEKLKIRSITTGGMNRWIQRTGDQLTSAYETYL